MKLHLINSSNPLKVLVRNINSEFPIQPFLKYPRTPTKQQKLVRTPSQRRFSHHFLAKEQSWCSFEQMCY